MSYPPLGVYPIAGVVPAAKEAGARVVIVNGQPTEMDTIADAVIMGRIGQVLLLVEARH